MPRPQPTSSQMACMADKIVAAPFAFIGSIGVRAQLVNVNEAISRLGLQSVTLRSGQVYHHPTGKFLIVTRIVSPAFSTVQRKPRSI